MKRGFLYEKEMLHWLDNGEIEVRYRDEPWEPFDGVWSYKYEYRIAEPDISRNVLIGVTNNDAPLAEKPRWLYVVVDCYERLSLHENVVQGMRAIGKIRMEDV